MLAKHAIEPVSKLQENDGFYSTFFVVPKKSGDLRPILNLRPLNKMLSKKSFKMETLQTVSRAVQPGDWLVSLDLQDAYLHIPIFWKDRKYLRFKIQNQAYQFKVLPFGLTAAPRIFTKVLAPLAQVARSEGIHVFPYLDDWLVKAPSRDELSTMLSRLVGILIQAGFIINLKKSHLNPTKDLVFIGGRFQTDRNLLSLPLERLESLQECLSLFRIGAVVTARQFLRLLGIMAAMISVVRFCRLHMRPIQMFLMAKWKASSQSLDHQIVINHHLTQHLEWWEEKENLLQGVPLNKPDPVVEVTTDASSLHGWGGYLGDLEVQGKWDSQWKLEHINMLEMEAVFKTCMHFVSHLQGKVVRVRCDNSTVVSYINKEGGTKSPSLCMLAWKLLKWAQSYQISLVAVHVAGVMNKTADRLSRQFANPLEWQLDRQVVQHVFNILDHPMIDLFASENNRQIQTYCSRFPEPLAFHVDALQMDWTGLFGYAFPPISLVPLVLERIEKYDCTIILIAPRWPRRSWFPRMLDLLVDTPVVLPQRYNLLSQRNGRLHHPASDKLDLTAWKLSANVSLQRGFRQTLYTQCKVQLESHQPGSMTKCGQYLLVGARKEGLVLAKLL